MKTPEEIKKGLECCTEEDGRCLECPYPIGFKCAAQPMTDALAYIQQLESRLAQVESTYSQVSKALCGKENATLDELLQAVDQLKSRLAQVERERAALMFYVPHNCISCKHEEKRYECTIPCKWEWRGPCPENTKEETNK